MKYENIPTSAAEFRGDQETSAYIVERSRLEGAVTVSGAKNSVLRLLAASLLTSEPVELLNFPHSLLDAKIHIGMLESLGKRCTKTSDGLIIEEISSPSSRLEWNGRSIRNTLLILGALLARTGAGAVPLPGGCDLGGRKHDLHVLVLESLGARVTESVEGLQAETSGSLIGADIRLPLRSTGATENAIICGALARGKTVLWNPHIRPEILDLISFLNKMGAKIDVFGQERIEIYGSKSLSGVTHRVIPDNMEALTWLVGASITDGDVEIYDFPLEHLEVPLIHLKASGVRLYVGDRSVIVRGSKQFPVEIATGPHPGINSDMQPLFALFGAMSLGESRIVDLRFPGRYLYAEELAKMGVQYSVENNLLNIRGGATLTGATVKAHDLRAGVALTLAGFAASGQTEIQDAWQIERGYDRFIEKATALQAKVAAA